MHHENSSLAKPHPISNLANEWATKIAVPKAAPYI